MQEVLESLRHFLPELALTAGLLLVVVLDAARVPARDAVNRFLTVASLATALVLSFRDTGFAGAIWSGMLIADPMGVFFKALLVGASLAVVLVFTFRNSRELAGLGQGEFYALMLAVTLSNLLLANANDLAMMYLALEMVSITSYVMVAYMKGDRLSNEASLKYILFGAVSTGGMLYGLSLLYGLTGTTSLPAIRDFLAGTGSETNPFSVYMIALFVFAGFGFKTAAVPFHFWCPDVYQGAPTPVTAFLSVASKAGGFVAILSLIYFGFFGTKEAWQPVLWALAAASMTLGNLTALRQTNIVRMLAYSSIAQGGFILAPLAVAGDGNAGRSAFEAVVVYLLIYGAMNLGAFAVVIAVARRTRSGEISSYSGLGQTAPVLALLMSAFLFALAGIPPLAGWFAKFVMFRAIFDAGTASAYTLGVIAAVNSVIALFYYAGVARRMWFRDPSEAGVDTVPARTPPALGIALTISAAVVLVIGVYPQLVARLGEVSFPG
jgi:NADH-quinone oxidoreductase subunit N